MATDNAPNQPDNAERIVAAALRLAGQGGWRTLALGDIAAEAGVTLSELARHYGNRAEILDGFERMIDRRMLAGAVAGDIGDKPRDRMFDIVMERFDALLPYKDGIRRVSRELAFDAPSSLVLVCALPRTVTWMFTGARVAIDGPFMPVKLAVMGAVYVAALRVWLNDNGQDLAKTMAALDRQLNRAERVLNGFGRSRPTEPPAAPQPAPEAAAPEPKARRTPRKTAPKRRATRSRK